MLFHPSTQPLPGLLMGERASLGRIVQAALYVLQDVEFIHDVLERDIVLETLNEIKRSLFGRI